MESFTSLAAKLSFPANIDVSPDITNMAKNAVGMIIPPEKTWDLMATLRSLGLKVKLLVSSIYNTTINSKGLRVTGTIPKICQVQRNQSIFPTGHGIMGSCWVSPMSPEKSMSDLFPRKRTNDNRKPDRLKMVVSY